MAKNITVGISDELSARMDELTEVNWSAVTRECIEQYIKQRTSGDLEQIIAKIKQKRSIDFKNGYEFVIRNVDHFGLPELEEIAYPDEEKHAKRLFELVNRKSSRMLFRKILSYEDEDDKEEPNVYFIVSSEFLKGMQEAAKEILEKSA